MTRTYRAYSATLLGDYLDIRGQQTTRADVYAGDRYDASQKFGEEVRASGGAGLLYDSLRRRTASALSRTAAQYYGHRTDRSFRNYRPGDVAHDRRPQTVALIKLLAAGTATPPVLANAQENRVDYPDFASARGRRAVLPSPPCRLPRTSATNY
jgi:hypothetical protein